MQRLPPLDNSPAEPPVISSQRQAPAHHVRSHTEPNPTLPSAMHVLHQLPPVRSRSPTVRNMNGYSHSRHHHHQSAPLPDLGPRILPPLGPLYFQPALPPRLHERQPQRPYAPAPPPQPQAAPNYAGCPPGSFPPSWYEANHFNSLHPARAVINRRRRGNLPREAKIILKQW